MARGWLCSVLSVLAACQASGLPEGFSEAARRSPGTGRCRLRVESGRVASVAIDVSPRDLPRAARRMADAVLPPEGGKLAELAKEWGPRGVGFRVRRSYGEPGADVRSVLVTEDGRVLERTHRIAPDELPAAVRRAAERARPGGVIEHADVVQGDPGEEGFRVLVREGRAATWLVECDARGEGLRLYRLLTADVATLVPERAP